MSRYMPGAAASGLIVPLGSIDHDCASGVADPPHACVNTVAEFTTPCVVTHSPVDSRRMNMLDADAFHAWFAMEAGSVVHGISRSGGPKAAGDWAAAVSNLPIR